MSKADISSKAGKAYNSARENTYVRRLIEDEELRASIIAAAVAAKSAYGRVQSSRSSAVEALTNDRKVKRELSEAADSVLGERTTTHRDDLAAAEDDGVLATLHVFRSVGDDVWVHVPVRDVTPDRVVE